MQPGERILTLSCFHTGRISSEVFTQKLGEQDLTWELLTAQVLTTDNVKALRDSVLTLTKTLQHIEGITGDLGGFTGDARNKSNLKQLIEALSRIVAD